MKKKTDGELMKLIAQGNQAAFQEVFLRYGSTVLGYASRILGNRLLAEDITQEVWIRCVKQAEALYQNQNRAQSQSGLQSKGLNLKAWLLTVTRNLTFNYLRGQNRFEFAIESFEDEFDQRSELPSSEEFLMILQKNETEQTIVKESLDKLPDSQRAALTLWLAEDLSYDEIATELDTSVSAVKSLLHRARQTLETSLSKQRRQGVL